MTERLGANLSWSALLPSAAVVAAVVAGAGAQPTEGWTPPSASSHAVLPSHAVQPCVSAPIVGASLNKLAVRLRPGWSLSRDSRDGTWRLVHEHGVSAPGVALVLDAWGVTHAQPLLAQPARRPALAAALGLDRDLVLHLAHPTDTTALVGLLASADAVFECAEAVGVGQLCDAAIELPTPNDPLFVQQYALYNEGQSIQGQAGAAGSDIAALLAWERARVARSVVVAVLDSGIAAHPDLPPTLPGWNVASLGGSTGDEHVSHGTHVAGIIAATHNNAVGIAGVARHARLLPVKVTNLYGSTSADWVAQGIIWAADNDADILNISIGFATGNTALHAAVQYAAASGCLVVASSGNIPTAPIVFPARYPETLAVGATDNRDQLASFSATGPELDVVAPGHNILSTWHQYFAPNTFQYRSGTSQAAPVVAGVAALVMATNANLKASEVRAIVLASCDDRGVPGWDPSFGHGRVNAARAVQLALDWGKPNTIGSNATTNCPPDLNRDGRVNSDDFFLFLSFYLAGDLRADFAVPRGLINTEDFFVFNGLFAQGCGG